MKYRTSVWRPFRGCDYRYEFRKHFLFGVIRVFFRDIRRCHQRIWRGYCDYDTFSIDEWFLGIMPTMLEDFRDHLHGCPVSPESKSNYCVLDDEEKDQQVFKDWVAILNRIIFLLREADEETCTRKNPCQEEFEWAETEFREKYGPGGEKIRTEEDREREAQGLGIRHYSLRNMPEYEDICDKWLSEERKIDDYRRECKDEALDLFSKWFYQLWD